MNTSRKTAKATVAYFGYDSHGRCVHLARRVDGQYFVRFSNGFGGLTRWERHNEPIKFSDIKTSDPYGPPVSCWGNTLVPWNGAGLRLPSVAYTTCPNTA